MQQTQLQLTALWTFFIVVKTGGISDGAQRLNVTAGAVRHQIRQLEAGLDQQLLIRSKRSFGLTLPGARLYETLSRSFEDIESACKATTRAGLEGELRVACAPALSAMRLMRVMAEFTKRLPLVTIRLFAMEDADDTMDLVIAYGDRPISGTRYAILKDEKYFAVCSPQFLYGSSIKSVDDLAAQVLLHADGEQDWQRLFRALGKPRIMARQQIYYPNAYLSIQAAKQDCGLAVGSSILCAEDLRRGTLVKVFDDEVPAPYPYFVIQPEAANKSLADAFAALLVEFLER